LHEIDVATAKFAAGDYAVDTNGFVSIETSADKTVATFKVSGTYTGAARHFVYGDRGVHDFDVWGLLR
jgi:hypothetical protein